MANLKRNFDLISPRIKIKLEGKLAWPLVFWGPPGTGKTCAALCLLDRVGGKYFPVPELLEQITQAQFGKLHDALGERVFSSEFWFRISRACLVVLDEVGCRERVSDAHYCAVKRVIDLRIGKPFIAISNLPLEELEKIYDGRIVSRLSAGMILEFSGQDRRL